MDPVAVAEQLKKTTHDLLWKELKERIYAVRDVMRRAEVLYATSEECPARLEWARLGSYCASRFSIEDDRWIVTYMESGRRAEIPEEFLNATPSECRRIARQIIAQSRVSRLTGRPDACVFCLAQDHVRWIGRAAS